MATNKRGVFIQIMRSAGILSLMLAACLSQPPGQIVRLASSTPPEGVPVEAQIISSPSATPSPEADLLSTSIPLAPEAPVESTASSTGIPFWDKLLVSLPSPDGKWTAEAYGRIYSSLKIRDENQKIVWEKKEYFSGREGTYFPLHWSWNSRFLYYTIHLKEEGYIPFNDGVGLSQVDVTTGEEQEILPTGDFAQPGCCPNWSSFSVSHDGSYLAYIDRDDRKLMLVLRNLVTGSEKRLWLAGYAHAGSMIWSPQQDWIALAMTSGDDWSNTLFSISRMRVNDLTQRILVKDDVRYLDPFEWVEPGEIVLKQRVGGYLTVNINTLKITPGRSPTAVP